MIAATDLTRLAPAEKAALIYAQAQSDVSARLWRAALGSDDNAERNSSASSQCPEFNLDSLLSLLMSKADSSTAIIPEPVVARPTPNGPTSTAPSPGAVPPAALPPGEPTVAMVPLHASAVTGLGPNARYRATLDAAAARTGIPVAALTAIVDAEAGKNCDGVWNTTSRNPRSSAAGLGQFLGGTWQGEAERAGTWLHDVATKQGWLGNDGRVLPAARSSLLALRYDATASINATADYALRSVAQLKRAGITIGNDVVTVARAAYLGHHLGTGDAIRFLKGGLDPSRAKVLLDAQIGTASANQRIAQSGDAAAAHRSWLLGFIDRHITPARFSA